ncbi:hypothetical protein GIB67_007459, partial [Kingdonia uniflora]
LLQTNLSSPSPVTLFIFENTQKPLLPGIQFGTKEGRIRIMGEIDDGEDSKHWDIDTSIRGKPLSLRECCITLGIFMKLEEEMGLALRWILWI